MARDWESIFTTWSQGPSTTEQEKSENAENQIRKAIRASAKLNSRNIKVFTQGSYRNRVNVRRDSDVDIGVLCFDTYFPQYPDDNVKMFFEKSTQTATYTYKVFKDELEESLVAYFGRRAVIRGNKAFDIKENTYRVEADVSAFFEHRHYKSQTHYYSGVQMVPDNNIPSRIRNWPEQHYENGVKKNEITNRKYKRVVRVLKSLRNEMLDYKIEIAKSIPSFLIECLVWNTPNPNFNLPMYKQIIRETLVHLYNNTISDDKCSEWGEVNEIKYLFRSSQPWTRDQVNNFILSAWQYIGYK